MSESNKTRKMREYRKGNPLTQNEHNIKYKQKKLASHEKELRVFIPQELKEELVIFCKKEGFSQSAYLTMLLGQARKSWK
ncbi:RepB family protein [Photorhabdus luminescens]|uniref:RepB family protein n=1 Tax=Photorhabdus luminescens TaxID=29488 RepID=UPI002240A136|nr:RepB family protein [Photorhabdus luminescens]MCW7763423.1 replication protein [Photorhabdus luminescens subsp. venezuelensis]